MKLDLADWAQAIDELTSAQVEKPEPGYYTVAELSERKPFDGLSLGHVHRKVTLLFRAGKLQRKHYKVEVGQGVVRLVAHYRLK